MSTDPARWFRALSVGLLLGSIAAPAWASDPEENLSRVRTMSRDERARLANALEAFDTLPREEREAIRTLDTQLAGLEPEARGRLLATLRRYHVFYTNLPDDKKKSLDAATDPAKKLELIATYRAEQSQRPTLARSLADGVQVSTLSTIRLRVLARELIVYFSLDPVADAKERAEFARKKLPNERRAFAAQLIQDKSFADQVELRERLREGNAEFQEAEQKLIRNPILARRLSQGEKEQSKFEQSKKKTDGPRAAKEAVAKLRDGFPKSGRVELVEKLDEQQVIRDLDAETVDPARLEAFDLDLPPWARQSFDDLPPDAARRRLKALYRLVFPAPAEYQPPKAKQPARKPTPSVTTPTGAPSVPF